MSLHPARFLHVQELEVTNLSDPGTQALIKLCGNVRKLFLAGNTNFMDLIEVPCLGKLEVLNLCLAHNREHDDIQMGYARRQLRMPHLRELSVISSLMPRFLNALVENAPKLETFSLHIHLLHQWDAIPVSRLSDTLVRRLTHYIIDDDESGTAPALCIDDFVLRKDESGAPIFRPKQIDVVSGRDILGIWTALRKVPVTSVFIKELQSSLLIHELPKDLRKLEIGALRLDVGRQRDALERAVNTFVREKGGKIGITSIYNQTRGEGLDDDNWISETDFWVETLGLEIKVVPVHGAL